MTPDAKGPGGRGRTVGPGSRQRKVSIDEPTWQAAAERAKRDGISRGELIRRAIAERIAR